MSHDTTSTTGRARRHAAGLFDIRNIIGTLLAIYGIVLLLTAFFGSSGRGRSGPPDSHANLWMGIALLVVGVFFVGWAKVRPIVVDEAELKREMATDEDGSTMHP
jgi:drug/metabolite transporter (DMT)-like permease